VQEIKRSAQIETTVTATGKLVEFAYSDAAQADLSMP
jgi:hypothetical protein